MKKWLVSLIFLGVVLLCIIGCVWNALRVEYKYDLMYNAEPVASKILYDYILTDLEMTPREIEEFARISPESVRAFEYDLNGDGTKETIGVVYSTYYYGSIDGYHLFVLQNRNDTYKDISSVSIEPIAGDLVILSKKKNGYYKLFVTKRSVCEYNPQKTYFVYAYTLDIVRFIRTRLFLWSMDFKK